MSDSLMHSIWSKYTISPEPGMSTLRDTCVALLNHSLSSSDLVPALAGVAFHPWLAEPLREVIPALKHLLYAAMQHREALFDYDHSDFRLATILGLRAEEVAGAWGRLKQKLASIMKCIEHICERHPRYCTPQAPSALPSFAVKSSHPSSSACTAPTDLGESHCSLYTSAPRSSPTSAPRKDFHSRQTDCTVEEFLDNGTVNRAEGVKPAKSCDVERSTATHEFYSGHRSGGRGEELAQVGTGIAVEQAGAPAASKLYVDAGHMDERVSVKGESISEGLTEGSILSPSSRGLETPPYQANIDVCAACAPEDVPFAALLPLRSQDVQTALCKSSAVEHAGLNESLLENSAAARDSAILSRGSMEGQVARTEHSDVKGGLQESPGPILLRDSVSKLDNEDKSGRAPRSLPRLARELSSMRSENCMIENGGLKKENAKSAQSSTNFHTKGVHTFGTFTGIGVDSRVTNRATGDACAVVGLSAAVGSDRGDHDVDTIADGVDDPGVGSEGVTNEAMATVPSVSKKEQDLQEGYARTSEESSYSLAPSIPAHERARDRANAKATRACHSSTVLRGAGTEPLACMRTASLSFADVANKSALTKPGGLKKSPRLLRDLCEGDALPRDGNSALNPRRQEEEPAEGPDESSEESHEEDDARKTITSIGEEPDVAMNCQGRGDAGIAVDSSLTSGPDRGEREVDSGDDVDDPKAEAWQLREFDSTTSSDEALHGAGASHQSTTGHAKHAEQPRESNDTRTAATVNVEPAARVFARGRFTPAFGVERLGAPIICEEPANMPDIREMDMRGAEVHAPGASAIPNRTMSAQNPALARTETDALEAGGLKGSPDKSSKESREDDDAPETFTSIGEGRAIPISASEGAVHVAGAPKDHHGADTYIAVDVSAASGSAHDESDVDFCDDEGDLVDEVEGLEEKEVKSAHSSEDSRANGRTLGIWANQGNDGPASAPESPAFSSNVDSPPSDLVILPAEVSSKIFALVSAIIRSTSVSYLGAPSLAGERTPYRGWEREGIGTGRWTC
ncbi:hypothetical protein B0H11DRAFT_2265089 [Mycena galericulata]|nr:hypothetical protein B0H11DRAFT_2265089 [Mycena galericulata]